MTKVGQRTDTSLRWARDGAILALVLSLVALALPLGWGGYGPWADWRSALQNLAAILTRVVVFGAIGATLGGFWAHHRHRRRQGGPAPRH